jgi:hypothetical protein
VKLLVVMMVSFFFSIDCADKQIQTHPECSLDWDSGEFERWYVEQTLNMEKENQPKQAPSMETTIIDDREGMRKRKNRGNDKRYTVSIFDSILEYSVLKKASCAIKQDNFIIKNKAANRVIELSPNQTTGKKGIAYLNERILQFSDTAKQSQRLKHFLYSCNSKDAYYINPLSLLLKIDSLYPEYADDSGLQNIRTICKKFKLFLDTQDDSRESAQKDERLLSETCTKRMRNHIDLLIKNLTTNPVTENSKNWMSSEDNDSSGHKKRNVTNDFDISCIHITLDELVNPGELLPILPPYDSTY